MSDLYDYLADQDCGPQPEEEPEETLYEMHIRLQREMRKSSLLRNRSGASTQHHEC
jgi:hypothetical protein